MKPIMLALLPLLALSACRKGAEEAPTPATRVRVVRAAAGGAPTLDLRGSVAPESRLRLGFRKGGVVATVRVREGDRVQPGQLLATLEDAEWKAGVVAARSALEKARRDLARAERLAGEGALPVSVAEDARTALAAAEAQAVAAEEGLSKLRLTAPGRGTVFQRLAEPGEAVGDGQPVVLLDTTGDLVVRAGLSEAESRRLRPGGTATLVTESGVTTKGRIRSVGASPNPGDGQYALEVIPLALLDVKAGALVRVRVEGLPVEPGVRVPVEALVRRQDRTYVCVVEAGEVIAHRPVTLLRVEGRSALLRTGLQGGERVVAEGGAFLQVGQTVRTRE